MQNEGEFNMLENPIFVRQLSANEDSSQSKNSINFTFDSLS